MLSTLLPSGVSHTIRTELGSAVDKDRCEDTDAGCNARVDMTFKSLLNYPYFIYADNETS